eukprot:5008011-Amphidinium_carterae.1
MFPTPTPPSLGQTERFLDVKVCPSASALTLLRGSCGQWLGSEACLHTCKLGRVVHRLGLSCSWNKRGVFRVVEKVHLACTSTPFYLLPGFLSVSFSACPDRHLRTLVLGSAIFILFYRCGRSAAMLSRGAWGAGDLLHRGAWGLDFLVLYLVFGVTREVAETWGARRLPNAKRRDEALLLACSPWWTSHCIVRVDQCARRDTATTLAHLDSTRFHIFFIVVAQHYPGIKAKNKKKRELNNISGHKGHSLSSTHAGSPTTMYLLPLASLALPDHQAQMSCNVASCLLHPGSIVELVACLRLCLTVDKTQLQHVGEWTPPWTSWTRAIS